MKFRENLHTVQSLILNHLTTEGKKEERRDRQTWSSHNASFQALFTVLLKTIIGFILCVVCPSIPLSVCPSTWNNSAPTEPNFIKFLYSKLFLKFVEKNQFLLKPDTNNGYFAWRPTYTYENILLNSSQNDECFRQTLLIKLNHLLCSVTFFSRTSYLL